MSLPNWACRKNASLRSCCHPCSISGDGRAGAGRTYVRRRKERQNTPNPRGNRRETIFGSTRYTASANKSGIVRVYNRLRRHRNESARQDVVLRPPSDFRKLREGHVVKDRSEERRVGK